MNRHNCTLGEMVDWVTSQSIKRVLKYAAILYVVQAVAGAVVGIYVGVVYPQEVIAFVTQYEESE